MARVQVSGMSPNVQLQPQATPVNTYAQPEQSTPTAAEMRAKILEGALSNLSRAYDREEERTYKEQMALKKDEIAIAATADIIRMKSELEPKLRGQSVENTAQIIDDEFVKRYGDIDNPYVKGAINGLFVQYKTQATEAALARIRQEQDQRHADDTMLAVGDYMAEAEANGHSDADFITNIDAIFKAATSTGRMTGVEFNKRFMMMVANGDPNQRGWRYIQAKKLDKTMNHEYEVPLDSIRSGIVKSANDKLDFDLKMQAEAISSSGGVAQMTAFIKQWQPILTQRGMNPDWMISHLSTAKTKRNEMNDLHARRVALERGVTYSLTNDGAIPPEGLTYVDHKGQSHNIPASEVTQSVRQYVSQNPTAPNRGRIETRVVIPENTKIFEDGVAYLGDLSDGTKVTLSNGDQVEKKVIAGQKFQKALDKFTEVYNRGGADAAQKQAGALFDLYLGATTLARLGSSPEDIAKGLADRKLGKLPPINNAQVDAMVDKALSETGDGWIFTDKGENVRYVRDQLERLYGLYRLSAINDEAAMETAVSTFSQTHQLVETDGVFILVNKNSLSRNKALSGGKDNAPAGEMIKKLGNAAKQFSQDITEEYPKSIGDRKVILQPNLMDPNKFTLTFVGGGEVPNSRNYTAAEINEADAKWIAGAQKRKIKAREQIYQDAMQAP